MTTYKTGNPIGSTAVKDLYDNAENLDIALHTSETTWVDRLGKTRRSWAGSTGYELLGDYEAGITVTSFNQIIRGPDGEFWRASAGTALPYVTTGDGLPEGGAFVSVGDAALRQQLADTDDPENGAGMVGYTQQTVRQRLLVEIFPEDFGAKGDGVTDDTTALTSWSQATGGALAMKRGATYLCKSTLTFTSSVQGHRATILFDIPATQDGVHVTSDDVVVRGVRVAQANGPSTNPADYGDAGGVGVHIEGDNVSLSRLTVVDFVNGVQWVPVNEDINSGTISNSYINAVGRGLLIARFIENDLVTAQAKNIVSFGNQYILQEENLPPGVDVEGLDGILVKWPSENFKSINDVIRNSPEHGVYAQGNSMYFENIDIAKNDSAHGDGLKISCPDGGAPGVGRFATAIAKGVKVRGHGIGIHGQYRTRNCVLEDVDVDGSANTLAAQSFGVYFSNPSDQSTGLSGKNWRVRGNRSGLIALRVGGELLLDSVAALEPSGSPSVLVSIDGPGPYGELKNANIYSPQSSGNSLYLGASIGHHFLVDGCVSSGTAGFLINTNSVNKVSVRLSFHNGIPVGHHTGSQSFSLPGKSFSSITQLNTGDVTGIVMPLDGIISAISLYTTEDPVGVGASVRIEIRKNGSAALALDAPVADFNSGRYVFRLSAPSRVFLARGDWLQVLVGVGTASWGSTSTAISATLDFM